MGVAERISERSRAWDWVSFGSKNKVPLGSQYGFYFHIQVALTRLSPLHLAGQLHPTLALIAQADLPPGATVIIIADEGDTRYSLLHQHDKAPHIIPNVRYEHYHCKCGCVHIAVQTPRPIASDEMLLYDENHPGLQRTLLVQFDGSHRPHTRRGGAGIARFLVEDRNMQLVEWEAMLKPLAVGKPPYWQLSGLRPFLLTGRSE